MTEHWYHLVGGKQFGPFSFKGLRERADIGVLHPADEVLRDGAKDWVEAVSVPGLFAPEAVVEVTKVVVPPNEAPAQAMPVWLLPVLCLLAGIAIGMGLMAIIFSVTGYSS
jgi:hypothetical protein